jgi:stringent starvation protein B
MSQVSTKPYLLRAIYEWCAENGFTPHLVVAVDAQTRVPAEYVKGGEIVLNIGVGATRNLVMGNDFIRFSARFGGVAREIEVPMASVLAIYARENGEGLSFPRDQAEASQQGSAAHAQDGGEPLSPDDLPPAGPRGKSHLRVVK